MNIKQENFCVYRAYGRIGNVYYAQNDLAKAESAYAEALSETHVPEIRKKLDALRKRKKEEELQAYLDPEKAEESRQEGNEFFKNGKL